MTSMRTWTDKNIVQLFLSICQRLLTWLTMHFDSLTPQYWFICPCSPWSWFLNDLPARSVCAFCWFSLFPPSHIKRGSIIGLQLFPIYVNNLYDITSDAASIFMQVIQKCIAHLHPRCKPLNSCNVVLSHLLKFQIHVIFNWIKVIPKISINT